MHAEVVTAIDQHLIEVQDLRRRLTGAHTIEPGERLAFVLRIVASADRLARTVDAGHLTCCRLDSRAGASSSNLPAADDATTPADERFNIAASLDAAYR